MRDHGTRGRYAQGCRCERCRNANSSYLIAYRKRHARQAWGVEPPSSVPAAPVREHIRALVDAGYSLTAIARVAGTSATHLSYLLRGTGGRPPATRTARVIAEAVLAVGPTDITAAAADGTYIDAAGTVRRVQALVAIGWSQTRLAERLGVGSARITLLMRADRVRASTARTITALYSELWDRPPPEDTPRRRHFVARTRAYAAERGWPRPMEWDDDLIDLPAADLEAELERRAAAMDDAEVRACHAAQRAHGDRSPLIAAGSREYKRRRRSEQKAKGAAA